MRHADDHIPIVATLARQTGKRVHPGLSKSYGGTQTCGRCALAFSQHTTASHMHNDYYTVRRASHTIERRYGLVSTAPADRTATPRPTRAETEKLARTPLSAQEQERGAPRLTDRERLRRHVRLAAAGSRTLPQFLTHLQSEGVLVRLRRSQRNPEQVTGYAVAFPDQQGQPRVWFGGGKLAPDLTLPALQHRFASHATYGTDAGGREGLARGPQRTTGDPRLEEVRARLWARLRASGVDPQAPSPGPQERAWKHACLAAGATNEYLADHADTDPDGAADAAWAAADLLHVAAQLVAGPAGGRLTHAAEAYERAARTRYRHRPAPTYAGYRVRKASALLLDTVLTAGVRRSNPQLAALLTQIAHLARTLSKLREAQQRLHEAQAARAAAGRVRASSSCSESRGSASDQGQVYTGAAARIPRRAAAAQQPDGGRTASALDRGCVAPPVLGAARPGPAALAVPLTPP